MAIPASQLETWAKQGSIAQSRDTYATIKSALEATDAGYAKQLFKVVLQGSYCNDTNVWSESDVDIVIRLDSIFFQDLASLTEQAKAAFQTAHPGTVTYGYDAFKVDVVKALTKKYGNAVTVSERAIKIKADGGRRSADVIVAAEFHRYRQYPATSNDVDIGMCFFTKSGDRIANYPEQHSANLTIKHKGTNQWFKPMVRILKNMRNKLVNDGGLADGVAPSYYLEGFVYNVPDEAFGSSYATTFTTAINWLNKANRTKMVCANREYYLFGTSAVQWSTTDCDLFLKAVINLWNQWGGGVRMI